MLSDEEPGLARRLDRGLLDRGDGGVEFLDGTNLSRSRWTYMINGHRYVQDPAVFEGLAAFFDVDAAFLLGEDGAGTPEKVAAQLDLVRSMRAAKVKSYAARTLGDISPKALQAITKFLDEEMTHMPEH